MSPAGPLNERKPRLTEIAAVVLVCGFLCIQVVIPLVSLFLPRPSRFSWQMFSGAVPAQNFVVSMKDGTKTPVQSSSYAGMWRPDIRVGREFAVGLCQRLPDAESVTYLDSAGKGLWEHACP